LGDNILCSVVVMIKDPELATFEACLRSILRSDGEKEILIVTPYPEKLRARVPLYPFIKFVKDPGNGIGIARNIGINAASSEIICFVDPDAIVGREHFIRIVEEFKKDPEVGLIDIKGVFGVRVLKKLNPLQKLDVLLWRRGRVARVLEKNPYFAGGTFMALRKRMWRQIGGFWQWPPYGSDDQDFSFRAVRAGWKIKKIKIKGSFHYPRPTLRELFKEQFGWGKGYACIIVKYRNNIDFWKAMRYHFMFYKLFPKPLYWMIPVMRAMAAPIGGLINGIKWKKLAFFPYWIFRRYAFLLGLLIGLATWGKRTSPHPADKT